MFCYNFKIEKCGINENFIQLSDSSQFNAQIQINDYQTTGLLQNKHRRIEWLKTVTAFGNIFEKSHKRQDLLSIIDRMPKKMKLIIHYRIFCDLDILCCL